MASARAARTISFLSDYGLRDEFVGVCKAVMLAIEPGLSIVDVTHGIAPHDVRGGALALARAAQYLPEGVILAVVDPGVGSDRRAVAVEVVERRRLVGPDNGLLAPAVAMLGGARRAVELTNQALHLAAPGPTFAGRDVFAPAAAHLARGMAITELGREVDPLGLVPGVLPLPSEGADGLSCEVLWEDRFGNLQLNVGPAELDGIGVGLGVRCVATVGSRRSHLRRVACYADGEPREAVLLVDSYGLASIAVGNGSAADLLELHAGSALVLAPSGEAAG